MRPPRVIITAGHDRSAAAEALAELLHRDGVDVAGVLVVSVFNVSRMLALVRQRGLSEVVQRVRQAIGPRRSPASRTARPDPLARFLERHRIAPVGLRNWCRSHGTPCRIVNDLNGDEAVAFVAATDADVVAYAGGGILRTPFLNAAKRVLNAHAGPLPEVRGMNAAEWAALLGAPAEVTIHFIDAGIDTGPVVRSLAYDRDACGTVDELRSTAVVRGLEGLRGVIGERAFETSPAPPERSPSASRQCFIMAPALVDRLQTLLADRHRESAP